RDAVPLQERRRTRRRSRARVVDPSAPPASPFLEGTPSMSTTTTTSWDTDERLASWGSLTPEARCEVAELLRDAFFSPEVQREPQRARFCAAVDGVVEEQEDLLLDIDGLSVSFFPSARRKVVRFVDVGRVDERARSLYARPSRELPHLAAVFVDPEEL